jgi:hypothetical protein
MQLNFGRILRRIRTKPLTPIIRNRIRKDVAIFIEIRRRNGAPDFRVALQPVLGVLVPEVEGAVATGCAERAVDGVEGDCVYGVHFCYVALGGVLGAVAFEGEVEAVGVVSMAMCVFVGREGAYAVSLSSTY